MAWTAPRTWNVGESPTAANFNTHVRDNLLFLHDSIPYAAVTATFAATLSSGVWTTLDFDSEIYDNASFHDNATNNSRLVITVAGTYELRAQVAFEGVLNAALGARFFKNNTTSYGEIKAAGSNQGSNGVVAGWTLVLAAADYVELQAWQNQGGDVDTITGGVIFTACRVGG